MACVSSSSLSHMTSFLPLPSLTWLRFFLFPLSFFSPILSPPFPSPFFSPLSLSLSLPLSHRLTNEGTDKFRRSRDISSNRSWTSHVTHTCSKIWTHKGLRSSYLATVNPGTKECQSRGKKILTYEGLWLVSWYAGGSVFWVSMRLIYIVRDSHIQVVTHMYGSWLTDVFRDSEIKVLLATCARDPCLVGDSHMICFGVLTRVYIVRESHTRGSWLIHQGALGKIRTRLVLSWRPTYYVLQHRVSHTNSSWLMHESRTICMSRTQDAHGSRTICMRDTMPKHR